MTIRITYNTDDTIDLNIGPNGLQKNFMHQRNMNFASSGKVETVNIFGIQELTFDARFQDSTYNSLVNWWSWARQGKSWSFAMDVGSTAYTTLTGGVTAGQTEIYVSTVTGGLSAGDICIVEAASDDEYELITVDSTDTGKVVASANLIYAYSQNDYFKHFDYFPKVVSVDTEFNPRRDGSWWSHTFRFIEEK